MNFLTDKALQRLRESADLPDLAGTRYSLLTRVARGGMGVVYAAQDNKLNRRVALKVLDAPDPNGELAFRLLCEAQVLASLEHPGIIPVHDVGTLADGRVFYTMKFVEGQRLDGYVQSVRSIPDRLRVFLRICDAIAFAHAREVMHRDLTPANVMIGPFGEVLVLDWGLAKILRQSGGAHSGAASVAVRPISLETSAGRDDPAAPHSRITGQGAVMGTPGYMSPEQAGGKNDCLDERGDVFSLGAMLRFLLTGVSPDLPQTGSSVDKSLEAVCSRACAASPDGRYATVTQLAADVSRYLDGMPVSARRETLFERTLRFYHRHHVAILLIAAYLLLRLVLLWIPWQHL
jgi:serine/threonine protein kinase